MGDQYQKMEETDALTQKEKKIINKYKEKYCDTNQSPIHKSGIFSKAFFMWMSPIFKVRQKSPKKNKNQFRVFNHNKNLQSSVFTCSGPSSAPSSPPVSNFLQRSPRRLSSSRSIITTSER